MAGKTSAIVAKGKRVYHRARGIGAGLGGGTFGPIIQGTIAGALGTMAAGKIPYAAALAYGGVGYMMKNPTLLTLAGLNLGASLPAMAGGVLGGTGNEGGEI